MGNFGHIYQDEIYSDQEMNFATSFDAVTNWVGKLEPGEKMPQEEHYPDKRSNFEGYKEFSEDHDIGFAPMIAPGFDDRTSTKECWGGNQYLPRSPEYFEELLELADDYRTIDRINIATWNDWPEGTAIEPGVFEGEDHGTEYLEVLRDFHQN